MERIRFSDLMTWLHSSKRLPLVIRGAPQVGKTWLVREICQITTHRIQFWRPSTRYQFISNKWSHNNITRHWFITWYSNYSKK